MIFTDALVRGRRVSGLKGAFTAEAAIERLLAGTSLGYERSRSGALMIVARSAATPPVRTASKGERSSPPPAEIAEEEVRPPVAVEPVVITALKRPQTAQASTTSLTAIRGDLLDRQTGRGLSDILPMAPGVQFNAIAPGVSSAAIRGITTSSGVSRGQGVVGYFIDETPLTDPYLATGAIEIDPFDLENITILRGPQTTLYGASAFGGAINFQTRKPDLAQREARLQLSAARVDGGAGSGTARAMVNLPVVGDVLALRATYNYRRDGGFVDNVSVGKNSNTLLTRSGRLQLAWVPTASTWVSLMWLTQSQDTADLGYEEEDPLSVKNSPFPEAVDLRTQLALLRVDQNTRWGTLTLQASRRDKKRFVGGSFQRAQDGAIVDESAENYGSRGDAVEIRLASPADRRLSFLLGAVYDQTRVSVESVYTAAPRSARPAAKLLAAMSYGYEARVGTLFAEAGYQLAPHWRIEVGGRLFRLTESDLAGVDIVTDRHSADFDMKGFTPKVTVSWRPDDRRLVYATLSKGARYGGLNIDLSGGPATTFQPDTLWNAEIGVKLASADRRISLDAAVFGILWRDVQVRLAAPGVGYVTNLKQADSYGFEGALSWAPAPNLAVQANLTYLDAELDLEPGLTPRDLVLPGAAKWRLSETVAYRWADLPLQPTLTLSHRFASRAPSNLGATPAENGYHVFNGRLTLRHGSTEFSLFVNNITDARGVTLSSGPQRFVEPPRTIGVAFDRAF
ncbi:TonB-dependent receptor domain-containing protein [Caulobacter mirabilis]|uniref:Secretin/TonB short N-terminal domain-containing protein n=1 Tax=Caulobacter mirabilis TaxID=69666 RepID=A0A2D2B2Y9_9CAUL|nr:TonB-dependent receptor [Caulobacter mirabilis]ATQ44608.1 hypothetical protein CSW64_20535 [Caulobacter mirabilis]